MSGNSLNFEDKTFNKSTFFKNKKLFHLNTSLDIMMMMSLDHYV